MLERELLMTRDLVAVVNPHQTWPDSMANDVAILGRRRVYILCSVLVEAIDDWMDFMEDGGDCETDSEESPGLPLELNESMMWCADLEAALRLPSRLGELFEITDGKVDFKQHFTSELKRRIGEIVQTEYRPEISWTQTPKRKST